MWQKDLLKSQSFNSNLGNIKNTLEKYKIQILLATWYTNKEEILTMVLENVRFRND